MESKYPNPCDTCPTADTCMLGYGCTDWKIRYWYRQKQINAYARKVLTGKVKKGAEFVYQHPNDTGRYLADGPCKACNAESVCDVPCPAYLRWYNARMEIARKKVGLL